MHADPARLVAAVPVLRPGRRLDDLARPEQPLERTGPDSQPPLDHLVPLDLARMHVRQRDEPPRPADEIELDEFAAALLRRRPELDPHAERGNVQHLAGPRRAATMPQSGALRLSRPPL
jgi:hypothetical protein